jgi:hypothetical protein
MVVPAGGERRELRRAVRTVCAVTLKPSGSAHHDGVADIMRTIVRECV